MKTRLLLLLALTFGLTMQAQTYQFSLIQESDYTYSVVAIPDFTSATPDPANGIENPIVTDQNFVIMLPDGATVDASSATGLINYNITSFGALDGAPVPGPGNDATFFNNVGENILPAHTANVPLTLVTFDVLGSPTSGEILLLDNSAPLSVAGGNGYTAYFIGIASGVTTETSQNNYVGQTGTTSHSFSTLGTVENELTGYSVYPNPATDVVTINGLENELSKVEVYNITGQRVLTSTTNMETINVGAFNAGVYFVKLSTDVASTTIKLVKE